MPSLQFAADGYSLTGFYKGNSGVRSLIEKSQAKLDALEALVKEKIAKGEYPDVKFETMLRDGIPEEVILKYSKKEKPLLIVMGTRGESQKDLELIGSVTAEVIDRSRSFVYAIPENAPEKVFGNVSKVALVTNFDQRDLVAFDKLIRTFSSYNFKLELLHLNDKEDSRLWDEIKLAGIKEYFKKQYPQIEIDYTVVDETQLLNNLEKYVAEKSIDVLCITNYKRNVFTQLFNPSIARKMVFHSNTPILVIK